VLARAPDAALTGLDGSDGDRVVYDPARRSLRVSQARRAAVARRAQRVMRGRRASMATALAMMGLTGGAFADQSVKPGPSASASTSSLVAAAQQALGIPADGIAGPQTRRSVLRFQRLKGLVADGIIGPQTLAALGLSGRKARSAPAAASEVAKTTGAASLLEAIAACESGGDPARVSSTGTYRGKYQFDRETWRSMGGKGDPAKAPEAEQDARAAKLMEQRGPSAWPACSAKVGAGR